MLRKKIRGLLSLGFILFLAACGSNESASSSNGETSKSGGGQSSQSEDGKITVVTTIAQIGEPLSVIGGDRLEVKSLMGPSVDPHLYQATHGDIQTIADADLVFYSGLHLEANMVDIFKEMSATKSVLGIGDTIDEQSLLKDENHAVDPHIWFDIDLWKQALGAAVEKLKEYSPDNSNYFEQNKNKYFSQLDELKKEAEKLQEIPKEKRVLVTAHDAFGYFGKMHDLEVVGLQGLSTDGEIGVSDIQKTINTIKEYQVPAVFVESSINESSIQAVIAGAKSDGVDVELGGELFSDAMGKEGTEEGTYIGMYRHNINTIYTALKEGNE